MTARAKTVGEAISFAAAYIDHHGVMTAYPDDRPNTSGTDVLTALSEAASGKPNLILRAYEIIRTELGEDWPVVYAWSIRPETTKADVLRLLGKAHARALELGE